MGMADKFVRECDKSLKGGPTKKPIRRDTKSGEVDKGMDEGSLRGENTSFTHCHLFSSFTPISYMVLGS